MKRPDWTWYAWGGWCSAWAVAAVFFLSGEGKFSPQKFAPEQPQDSQRIRVLREECDRLQARNRELQHALDEMKSH